MTKYYTMKECFDACGDDDMPFNEENGGYNNGPRKKTKAELLKNINAWDNASSLFFSLSDKWQIKRAERKVLSTDKIWHKIDNRTVSAKWSNDDIVYAMNISSQNGQIREWLRPEQVELREAVRLLCARKDDGHPLTTRLVRAFENLKPPTMD